MNFSSHDPGLFRPTISTADDATGFERPWNPHSIVFVIFFGGLISGGALFYLNNRRLGLNSPARRTLVVCCTVAVVIYAVFSWLVASGTLDPGQHGRWARVAIRLVNVFVGLGVASTQTRRYQLAVRSGVDTGSLWGPGIIAVLAGMAVDFAVIFLLLLLFATFTGVD